MGLANAENRTKRWMSGAIFTWQRPRSEMKPPSGTVHGVGKIIIE
jgi:hypothetical protein